MSGASITFAPHLPLWLLAAVAAACLLMAGLALFRRARGAWWRALVLALLVAALANPLLVRETRNTLKDVAVVVVDRSPSQTLRDRPQQRDEALAALRERLAATPDLELREVDVPGDGADGTALFGRLEATLDDIDRRRLAGVIALTDGAVHDAPKDIAAARLDAPFHVLLTGAPDETDRQLIVQQAPTYAMVGEEQSVVVRIEDRPASGEPVPVIVRQEGRVIAQLALTPGRDEPVRFKLDRAGRSVIEIEAAPLEGELTLLNNRVAVAVNGVRDRLRVLLVSGLPYPGLRVWRNLLKADPAVDLVHFTILRPPEKQDGTPIKELALIAFPSRELFEEKLDQFDLVIFDRYARRGLLPAVYLDNVARYVEQGGALLDAAGPEFAEPLSLYRTPLARVLPGRPSGEVFERPFTPTITELGQRHPVTSGLRQEGEAPWGRWFRQVDVEAPGGEVLMTGVADRPLLLLQHVGEGRVAQLLSDDAWLWARGFEGGGPQSTLLRRLVHWLMKEPELEEEDLRAAPAGDAIAVERQSLDSGAAQVTVTAPSGAVATYDLQPGTGGIATLRAPTTEDGLYRISDGLHTAYAAPRPIAPVELGDMRATAAVLAPFTEASAGSVRWLRDGGVPDIRRVEAGRQSEGRNWIGLRANHAYDVTGASETPILPAWLALALLLATAALTWWREGRS